MPAEGRIVGWPGRRLNERFKSDCGGRRSRGAGMNRRRQFAMWVVALLVLAVPLSCTLLRNGVETSAPPDEPPMATPAEPPPATAGPPIRRNGEPRPHAPETAAPEFPVEPPPAAAPRPAPPPATAAPVFPAAPHTDVPATPHTDAPAAPLDRHDSVDRILDELETANIAFNAPDAMNLEQTEIIHLVVGMSSPIAELEAMIVGPGETESHRIQVSDRMEARLTGTDFAITAITPEVQAVGRAGVTEWKWEITPKSRGLHHLHLTLTAIIEVEGRQTQRAIRTFDKDIDIYVTWTQQASGFFKSHWQWLWAAILLPLAGWIIKMWRARKPSRRRSA